jgi:hypothetical protein
MLYYFCCKLQSASGNLPRPFAFPAPARYRTSGAGGPPAAGKGGIMIRRLLRGRVAWQWLPLGLPMGLLLALLLPPRAALAQQPPPGQQLAQDFMLRVARVAGRLPGAAPGYGFIVGTHPTADGQPGLLIVTADHLVRDPAHPDAHFQPPLLTFYSDLAHPAPAELLDQYLPPDQGDLALLVVAATATVSPIAAVDPRSLLPGIFAWQAGRPGVMQPSETPGRFAGRADTGWLSFEGLDASPASAGAAVLVNRGLAGMIVGADPDRAGNVRVVPIDLIAAKLQAWGLNWQIAAPVGSAAAGSAEPSGQTPLAPPHRRNPLASLEAPTLRVLPLLPSEAAARASWVPNGARLSPWATRPAALMTSPSADAARVGTMPPGTQLPMDLWSGGAYQILSKLDRGAWFLAGSDGQPIGYVAGNDIIEVWPAPPQQTPIAGKLVREWTVEGGQHAELRDAASHYELSLPMTCKLDFCNQVMVYTPLPPAAGAIVPPLSVPPITGSWQRNAVVDIHLQLPRYLVETKGAKLLGCIGRADSCEDQTLLTGR